VYVVWKNVVTAELHKIETKWLWLEESRATNSILVALKCFQNQFISEKYKRLQAFKLHFFQNSSLVQIYTSASDCKGIGSVHGSHFVKAFPALPSHS
jgi:hypothetical protein